MGKTIGIIGGGQLGMMLAEEIRALGGRTVCLDPSPDAPAFAVAVHINQPVGNHACIFDYD